MLQRTRSILLFLIASLASATALAGNVTTVVGTGVAGFSGDGGTATAANLNGPRGIAVAPDGTIYFADNANFRIRSVSPAGIISTIAGTGNIGDAGDGGLAVNATLSGVLSIALNPPAGALYIADIDNNRVRRVDLTTGVITNFAGTGIFGFGYGGDGGPATSASLAFPEGVAVGSDGSLYIADAFNCIIRKVDTASIITTVAGNGACVATGDGGNALLASFALPTRVSVDGASNLFVIDANTIRRIDSVTNIITSVAGGGITAPGSGPATNMNLGNPADLITDAAGQLYIANFSHLFKVDLASGVLSVFAGTGVSGFSGDGGPATSAQFNDLSGLAFTPAGALLVADAGNHRIRSIAPDAPVTPFDVVLSLATSQAFLDSLLAVQGSIGLINVGGRDFLLIPNLASVGLDVTVTGNDQLLVVDLGALQSVGGSIDISGNLAMTTLDLGALTAVGGNLTLTNDPSLSAILISGVTSIGGNLSLIGTAATAISMPFLGTVGGSLDISGNQSAISIDIGSLASAGGAVNVSGNSSTTTIDIGSLASVGGAVNVSGNSSTTTIDIGSLASVGGAVNVSGNSSTTTIDIGLLTSAGGAVNVSGNSSTTTIDVGSLTSAGGTVNVSGNSSVATIDLSSLSSVSGDVVIVGNGPTTTVSVGSLTSVSGSVMIETSGTGTFPVGNGQASGNLTLDTTGYTNVSGTTAGGATDLTNTTLDAVMHLQIQAATFTTPVSFTVTRLDPVALVPESGLTAGGGPAAIDPVAAYQFAFAIPGSPTLTPPATLTFDIDVAALDAAGQTAFLAALASNSITLAVKGDAPASQYQAFTVCDPATSQLPLADATGCVHVVRLDAAGVPLPVDSLATPAFVRIQSIIAHFSTYAVVIVTPTDTLPPVLSGVPADMTVTSSVPLAVNWTDPAANDAVSGSVAVTCSPASGSIFALGTTPVSCSATDASGNTATAGFSVTVTAPVVDVTPPVISGMPGNIAVASSVPLAVTWPAPSANDAVSGILPVTCAPASGSIFPLGITAVSCSASDAAGNTATAGFSVTVTAPVVDVTPPVISGMPGNIAVTSSVPLAVTWPAPTANDAVSGILPVTCVPASGSIFPLGITAVSCTATDAAGNSASAGFTVTVTAAPPPTTARKVIEPKLECVKTNGPGSFTARFGYNNANKVAVTIPVGPDNAFAPLPADRGQTTTFLPKRQKNTFAVDFDGNRITWALKGPDGKTRSASATRKSDRCR
ncbi:MAG: HYR domain-containing protein [Gallionella sp.]